MEKNKRIGLLYGGMAIIGLLFFAFLAMPFAIAKVSYSGYTIKRNFTGYDLINFQDDAGVSIVIVFMIVGAILLAFSSIIYALCKFNVIKNKDVEKISKNASDFLSLLMVVLSIVNIGLVADYASGQNELAKLIYESYIEAGASVSIDTGWFALIVLMLLALGTFVCFAYARKFENEQPAKLSATSGQAVSDAPKVEEKPVAKENDEEKTDSSTKN